MALEVYHRLLHSYRHYRFAEQDMALDHGVVGVGTRFSTVLVGPMIPVMRQMRGIGIILGLSGEAR